MYHAFVESALITKKEINVIDFINSLCIFTLSEKTKNEWAWATKEHRRSLEHIISIITSKTASSNKITWIIKHKIKIRTKASKLRAR